MSVVSTNPNTLLGYGTWAAIGAGRVLIGQNVADTDFDVLEETGGAKTVAAADHAALAHSAHAGGAVDAHGVTQPTAHGAVSAHAGTAVGTSGAGSSHLHVANPAVKTSGLPSGTNTVASGAGATPAGGGHTHQTDVDAFNTDAEATHTHAAGTVTQPSDHSALTNNHAGSAVANHAFTQPSAHSDHAAQSHAAASVVQPYLVVCMWKRTA
jgi:hypothetical protein